MMSPKMREAVARRLARFATEALQSAGVPVWVREDAAVVQEATDAIISLLATLGAGEGWVLVPVEPTHEMICAGDGKDPGFGSRSAAIYRAMIAARPEQGRGGGG